MAESMMADTRLSDLALPEANEKNWDVYVSLNNTAKN